MHVQNLTRGAAALLMQIVYILSDNRDRMPFCLCAHLQLSEGLVRFIRHGLLSLGTPRIVKVLHKLRVLSEAFRRCEVFQGILRPDSIPIAEGSQTAFSRNTGARQDNNIHNESPVLMFCPAGIVTPDYGKRA